MENIDETLDCFDYCDSMVESLIEAKKSDGDISISDLMAAVASNAPEAMVAFAGMGEIDDELKDLDSNEKEQLASRGVDLVRQLLLLLKP